MPGRCARRANRHAVERFDQPEEPVDDALLREVGAHLLVGERVARRLELLRCERHIPRFERRESELVAGENDELRIIALGVRLRAACEILQECDHFADVLRHLGHERERGKIREAQQLRCLAAQLEDARDERRVVPFRLRTELRRAGRIRAVQLGAERAVFRVRDHRPVAGHAQRQLPAGAARSRARRRSPPRGRRRESRRAVLRRRRRGRNRWSRRARCRRISPTGRRALPRPT